MVRGCGDVLCLILGLVFLSIGLMRDELFFVHVCYSDAGKLIWEPLMLNKTSMSSILWNKFRVTSHIPEHARVK